MLAGVCVHVQLGSCRIDFFFQLTDSFVDMIPLQQGLKL
jgi:hypothetical protein